MKKLTFAGVVGHTLVCLAFALTAFLSVLPAARAQVDYYGQPRYAVLPSIVLSNVTSTVNYTNPPIDTRGMVGTAALFLSLTNNGINGLTYNPSTTVTLYGGNVYTQGVLYGSWPLTNLSYATLTAMRRTNAFVAANAIATNWYLLPGTLTTPTAATAGIASPYLDPATNPFTNAGPVATSAAAGQYLVGLQIQDQPRYITAVWSTAGSNSIIFGSGVLVGRVGAGAQ